MADDGLFSEVDDVGVGWLVLDRPDVHNAFGDVMIAAITARLRELEADGRVRAVAVAARGKTFSAGADLEWMRRMAGYSHAENVADALRLAEMLHVLDRLRKPVIALVQGPTYGGGVGLIAACDIVVAADAARFALTEVKLGLLPATISPYVIAAIGARQARRYFLTAETFDAEEAQRIGLVHAVVPAALLEHKARAILGAIMACGPEAVVAAKDLIRTVAGRPVDAALMRETAEKIAKARASEEARPRISAFLEKRGSAAPGT